MALPEGPADLTDLVQNEVPELKKCSELLAKVVGNILAHPAEAKYRSIKTTNPKFGGEVWGLQGAPAFLSSIGFRLEGESIVFPEGTPFAPLTSGLAQLQALCSWAEQQSHWPPAAPSAAAAAAASSPAEDPPPLAGPPPPLPSGPTVAVEAQQVILEEIRREKRKRLGKDLTANRPEVLEDTLATLGRILDNCLQHPGDERYSRIRASNAQFRRTVYDVAGGEAFMAEAGFQLQEVDGVEFFVLPPGTDPELLQSKLAYVQELQERNSQVVEAERQRQQEQSREAMRKLKAGMMQQLKAAMVSPADSASSSAGVSPAPALVPDTPTAPVPLATRQQLLRRLLNGAETPQARDNEVECKALQLIEDVAVLMEFHSRLSGEMSLRATWNIEKRRLYEKFKEDRDIAYLHDLMEEWEEKVQQLKRRTGKVFIDLEASPAAAPHPIPPAATDLDDLDAAVEARYRRVARK